MRHAKYIGPRPMLKGRFALLREKEGGAKILAQFDLPEGFPPDSVCFGWHVFDSEDFALSLASGVKS